MIVIYDDNEALISINDMSILRGSLPPRVMGLAMEWARLHQAELLENWNMVKESGKYFKINPLT